MASDRAYLKPGQPFVTIQIGDLSRRITLTQENHFRSMEARWRLGGGGDVITLKLHDPNFGEIADLLLRRGMKFVIQFGWRGSTRDDKGRQVRAPRSRQRVFDVLKFESELHRDGEELTLYGVNGNGSFRSIYGVRARAFDPQLSSSDIARKIILEELGLDDAVVEETNDGGKGGIKHLRAGKLSPLDYIEQFLVPRVKGATNQNFSFYISENVGFFVSETFERRLVYRQYLYQRDQDGDVISFQSNYNHLLIAALGGVNVRFEGYDLDQKTVLRKDKDRETDNNGVVPLAGKVPAIPLDPDAVAGRYYAVPFSTQSELDAYAAARFTAIQRLNVSGDLEILGDPQIPLHNRILLAVMILRPDGGLHPMSGYWFPREAIHRIESSGSYTTSLALNRFANLSGDKELDGLSTSNLDFSRFVDRSVLSDPRRFARLAADPSRAALGFEKKSSVITGK